MPQEVYTLVEFRRDRTYEKLVVAIKRGSVSGDISDEETARTKGVLSLYIKVNSDKVPFQISPCGKLTISHPDNSKLRKARSKLQPLILCSQWVPKYVSNETKELKPDESYIHQARLEHSKILISEGATQLSPLAGSLEELPDFPNPIYKTCFLRHLETGYPKIYDQYRRCNKRIKLLAKKAADETMKALQTKKVGITEETVRREISASSISILEDEKYRSAAINFHSNIWILTEKVKNGTPLEGGCELCPSFQQARKKVPSGGGCLVRKSPVYGFFLQRNVESARISILKSALI